MAAATRVKHSKLDNVQINQGLTIVYPDPDQPRKSSSDELTVDIIAVPGLGANPVYTWKSHNKVDWIRDGNMLRRTVEKARIMVFEYESQWFGRGSIDQKLSTVADQLLQAMAHARPRGSTRPIVFVCHCLGGIVVEQALIKAKLRQNDYPNIYLSVAGCVFLGTPFKGTKSQSKASLLAEMAQAVGLGTNSGLVKLLEEGSETLKELLHDFSMLAGEARMRLFCFFEQHESDVAKMLSKKAPVTHREIIVDEDSAEILGHDKGALAADHFELNKFTGPKDGRYLAVSGEISAIVQAANGILKSRRNALREALIDDATWQAKLEELNVTDPAKDMMDSVRGRITSQASWILSNEHFIEWESKHAPQTLWIHGGAGKGQAVIAYSLVQKLKEQSQEKGVFLSSFFCDEKDAHRRTVADILKVFIRQLILKERDLTEHLLVDRQKGKKVAEKPQKLDDLSVTTLWNSLQSILGDPAVRKAYFLVNGLDETDLESRSEFFDLLGPYLEGQSQEQPDMEDSVVKWIFLSRSGRPDIERTLHKALVVDMDDKENDDKVNLAVKAEISTQVDKLAKQKNYNAGLTYFIKKHIHSRAEGNYIYVNLVVQELKNLDSTKTTVSSIRRQLEDFPYGLTEMFTYIRRRVLSPQSEGIETTKEILRCLIVSQRSPSIFELALIADLPTHQRNDEFAIKSYITRCGAFVTVSEDEDQSVAFIDVAAREHLENYAKDELSLHLNDVQHGILALRCLDHVRTTFRNQDQREASEFEQSRETQDSSVERTEIEDAQSSMPTDQEGLLADHAQAVGEGEERQNIQEKSTLAELSEHEQDAESETRSDDNDPSAPEEREGSMNSLEYPCQFWLEHAKEAPVDLVEEFVLDDDFWAEDSSSRDLWWSAYGGFEGTTGTTPLHFAASSGYLALVNHLLDEGRIDDINSIDSWGYRPLDWACYYGHFEIVQRFVKAGADVNTHGQDGDIYPLWLAVSGSHVDVVEYLLEHRALTNVQDESLGTPLYVAAETGCTSIAGQLLKHGSNVNIVGGLHRRPINAAAYNGHTEIIGSLLQGGTENDPDEEYQYGSALGAASRKGHNDAVKLLLQNGWNVNRKLKKYYSSLVVAATYGHVEVVNSLLEHNADIKSQELALENASKNGKADVVKILLEQPHPLPHEKAFLSAASHGRDDVIRLLQPCGVSPETLSMALYQASDSEHETTVELLLEFGGDPDAEGPEYGNALIAAANDGTKAIVQTLLENKADVNKRNDKYGTALQVAASFGDTDIVQQLLDFGAGVNTGNIGQYGSALQAACFSGEEKVVSLLLEHGADVNAEGGLYGYAIIAAADEAPDTVVKMLVEHGANVNVRDARDNQPLLVVAGYSLQKETIEILLDHGAQIDDADDDGNTALIITADSGDKDGVKLLLDRGAAINASGNTYGTALHAAASEGDEECLQILIAHGADANYQSGPWSTPLQAAAFAADVDCIKLLLGAGADIHLVGGDYGTALQAAAFSGALDCIKALVEAGADVTQDGGTYGSPLQAAATSGNLDCVQFLLEKGANINQTGGMYNTPLQGAAAMTDSFECVKLLLDHGADPLITGGLFGSVMQAAAVGGEVAVWTILQEHGADIHSVGGKYGNTLQAAAIYGRSDFVRQLLERSVDVNEIGGKYCTALQAAAFAGQHDVAKTLCEHGADARICGGFYGNAIDAAVVRNCTKILSLLLDQALPDSMLDDALVKAVQYRRVDALEMLLAHGASVETRDETLGSLWNILDCDVPDDENSDDGEESEDEEDEEDEDDDEDEDGEDEDSETDDSDQGSEVSDGATNDGTNDDASNASLEIEQPSDDHSKILKLLNDAKSKLKRNPGVTRFPTIKRKPLPQSRLPAGDPQSTTNITPNVSNTGIAGQRTGPDKATFNDHAPEPVPLHRKGKSQNLAAIDLRTFSANNGRQDYGDQQAYQSNDQSAYSKPYKSEQIRPQVTANDDHQAYGSHFQESNSQQSFNQQPSSSAQPLYGQLSSHELQAAYPALSPYDPQGPHTTQPHASFPPFPSSQPAYNNRPPQGSQPNYSQSTSYTTQPPYSSLSPQSQPSYSSSPSQSPQPTYPPHDVYPQNPPYNEQPSYPGRPSFSDQPSYSSQASYSNRPTYPAQPSYSSQTSYPTRPSSMNQSPNPNGPASPPASLVPGNASDSLDAAFLQARNKASKFSSSVSKFWK